MVMTRILLCLFMISSTLMATPECVDAYRTSLNHEQKVVDELIQFQEMIQDMPEGMDKVFALRDLKGRLKLAIATFGPHIKSEFQKKTEAPEHDFETRRSAIGPLTFTHHDTLSMNPVILGLMSPNGDRVAFTSSHFLTETTGNDFVVYEVNGLKPVVLPANDFNHYMLSKNLKHVLDRDPVDDSFRLHDLSEATLPIPKDLSHHFFGWKRVYGMVKEHRKDMALLEVTPEKFPRNEIRKRAKLKLVLFNLETKSVMDLSTDNAVHAVLSPNGKYLAISDSLHRITIYDLTKSTPEKLETPTLTIENTGRPARFSPEEDILYIEGPKNNTAYYDLNRSVYQRYVNPGIRVHYQGRVVEYMTHINEHIFHRRENPFLSVAEDRNHTFRFRFKHLGMGDVPSWLKNIPTDRVFEFSDLGGILAFVDSGDGLHISHLGEGTIQTDPRMIFDLAPGAKIQDVKFIGPNQKHLLVFDNTDRAFLVDIEAKTYKPVQLNDHFGTPYNHSLPTPDGRKLFIYGEKGIQLIW